MMTSAKVVPDAAVYQAETGKRSFPVDPINSNPATSTKVLLEQQSVAPHLASTRFRDRKYQVSRSLLLFTLVVGLVLIIGGATLTWWGTQSEVKDLLVLGPGLLIIGFFILVFSLAFGIRTMYLKIQQRNECFPSEQKQKNLPEDTIQDARPPTGDVLYGTVAVHGPARTFGSQTKVGPMPTGAGLEAPMVAFPSSAIRSDASPRKDKKTWTTQINPKIANPDSDILVVDSREKTDNSLVKSRPDSVYEADTFNVDEGRSTKLEQIDEL